MQQENDHLKIQFQRPSGTSMDLDHVYQFGCLVFSPVLELCIILGWLTTFCPQECACAMGEFATPPGKFLPEQRVMSLL